MPPDRTGLVELGRLPSKFYLFWEYKTKAPHWEGHDNQSCRDNTWSPSPWKYNIPNILDWSIGKHLLLDTTQLTKYLYGFYSHGMKCPSYFIKNHLRVDVFLSCNTLGKHFLILNILSWTLDLPSRPDFTPTATSTALNCLQLLLVCLFVFVMGCFIFQNDSTARMQGHSIHDT